MTSDEFDNLARIVWGAHYKSACARTYGVLGDTVRAWQRGMYRIPQAVADDLVDLAGWVQELRADTTDHAWEVIEHDAGAELHVEGIPIAYRPPGVSEDDHLQGWRLIRYL